MHCKWEISAEGAAPFDDFIRFADGLYLFHFHDFRHGIDFHLVVDRQLPNVALQWPSSFKVSRNDFIDSDQVRQEFEPRARHLYVQKVLLSLRLWKRQSGQNLQLHDRRPAPSVLKKQ